MLYFLFVVEMMLKVVRRYLVMEGFYYEKLDLMVSLQTAFIFVFCVHLKSFCIYSCQLQVLCSALIFGFSILCFPLLFIKSLLLLFLFKSLSFSFKRRSHFLQSIIFACTFQFCRFLL